MSFGAAPSGGFSFGVSTPAPAPSSGGGFSFGGSTPAPAPSSGGFSFGGSTPAPAPSSGAFSFGGSTPAPAPTNNAFSFGGSSTPAPAPGAFGFGASAPAPAATGFATNSPAPQPQQSIAGYTPYDSLPDHYKQAIDRLHEIIMTNKRTLAQVSDMAPRALTTADNTSSTGASATNNTSTLTNMLLMSPVSVKSQAIIDPSNKEGHKEISEISRTIQQCHSNISKMHEMQSTLEESAKQLKQQVTTTVENSYLYAKWPLEAVAVRRGVRLSSFNDNKDEEKKESGAAEQTAAILREVLNRQLAYVDRVENLPSPFMWQLIEEYQKEYQEVETQVSVLKQRLQKLRDDARYPLDVQSLAEEHHVQIYNFHTHQLSQLQQAMEHVRQQYHRWERYPRDNVLYKAQQEAMRKQKHLDAQVQLKFLQQGNSTAPAGNAPAPSGAFASNSPAPANSFSFSNPAPAPNAFSFGSPAPVPGGFGTPAPATGGFGTPAPAPGGFGTPAPAPGGFGTPAPSTFSFGGSTPAASTFGAATKPTATSTFGSSGPNKKKTGRSTSRGRR